MKFRFIRCWAGLLSTALGSSGLALATVPVNELLPGYLAARLHSADSSGRLGSAAAGVLDFDGDGYPDLVMGAGGAARGSVVGVGRVYIIYGTSLGILSRDLTNPAYSGLQSVVSSGSAGAGSGIGISVAPIGDFNGDGRSDFAVGSAIGRPSSTAPGRVWIVFGRSGRADIDLDGLGDKGIVVSGSEAGDGFGMALAGGGSVNGDARGDLIAAAPYGKDNGRRVYAIYGNVLPQPTLSVSSLDGLNGSWLVDSSPGNFTGASLAMGGDVDGDGIGDVLVASSGMQDDATNLTVRAYYVRGRLGGFGASGFDLGALDGLNGARFLGPNYGVSPISLASSSVGFLGDQNGDGRPEMLIGLPDASPDGRANAGETFIANSAASYSPSVGLSTLEGDAGWRIIGAQPGDRSGAAVLSADVNRDGRSDVILSIPQSTPMSTTGPGRVALLFGSRPAASFDLARLEANQANGDIITGPEGSSGFATLARYCLLTAPNGFAANQLLLGSPNEGMTAGAGYLLYRTDRIFFSGVD